MSKYLVTRLGAEKTNELYTADETKAFECFQKWIKETEDKKSQSLLASYVVGKLTRNELKQKFINYVSDNFLKECAKAVAKLLKDKDARTRCNAAAVLGRLSAEEYTKDIALLLTDKFAGPRGNAVWALGKLGAKKYVKKISNLQKDSNDYGIYDIIEKKWKTTTVGKTAQQVLKDWEA